MEKLKIAIVGCGGIANQKHMPSIRANAEKAEMVAFCDMTVQGEKYQVLLGYSSMT